jgi:hypothetical protein
VASFISPIIARRTEKARVQAPLRFAADPAVMAGVACVLGLAALGVALGAGALGALGLAARFLAPGRVLK